MTDAELKKTSFLAMIEEQAAYARRTFARCGDCPQVRSAAAYTIQLIREFRTKYGKA